MSRQKVMVAALYRVTYTCAGTGQWHQVGEVASGVDPIVTNSVTDARAACDKLRTYATEHGWDMDPEARIEPRIFEDFAPQRLPEQRQRYA